MAIVLTAKLVGWQGDADIHDATLRADALVDKDVPEVLNVGIVLRVLLDKGAVEEAQLPL